MRSSTVIIIIFLPSCFISLVRFDEDILWQWWHSFLCTCWPDSFNLYLVIVALLKFYRFDFVVQDDFSSFLLLTLCSVDCFIWKHDVFCGGKEIKHILMYSSLVVFAVFCATILINKFAFFLNNTLYHYKYQMTLSCSCVSIV